MSRFAFCLAVLTAFPAFAAYRDLIAAGDGHKVYYRAGTGLLQTDKQTNSAFDDVSADGSVRASTTYGERYCGFAGSTCWVAPPCSASLTITGPGFERRGPPRKSFVRLDRAGRLAWIDQTTACPPMAFAPNPDQWNGLYELPTMDRIAPANGAKLANNRPGRRLITGSGRALVFIGPQMHWLDATGARQIRHVYGSDEAVTDARGDNIVYVDASPNGWLHWIEAGDDRPLDLYGSAPALTDDGRTLVFLTPGSELRVYDRATRQTRELTRHQYLEFTVGGPAVFAVTTENRLVRIDLDRGEVTTAAEPFPEITSIAAPPTGTQMSCPLICYGTPAPWYTLGRSMVVVVEGRWLNLAGWQVRSAGVEMPLYSLSNTGAWFRVPLDIPRTGNTQQFELYNPDHPLKMTFTGHIQDRVVACLGTLHQDFTRAVTEDDPARPGEIVHIYLTGLHGGDPSLDGVPAPLDRLIPVSDAPPFADPGAGDPVFFGLAPGLIGIQQLDYRVLRASDQPLFSFASVNAHACHAPPVLSAGQ
jgi:uncharacterized protein (TIGR03437 family)